MSDLINDKNKKDEKEHKTLKNSELLIEAIKKLTEIFTKSSKEKEDEKSEKPEKGIKGAIKSGLKKTFGDKADAIKAMGTKEGILDLLSMKAGGGLLSSILSSGAEHIRGQKEEADKKKKFISGFLTGTDRGRDLVKERGISGATDDAEKLHTEKKKLDKEIEDIEIKRKTLRDSGVVDADLSKDELEHLDKKKVARDNLFADKPKQTEPNGKNVEPDKIEPEMTTEELVEKIYKKHETDVDKTNLELNNSKLDEAEVKTGMQEELLDINQEQLEALQKLVFATRSDGEKSLSPEGHKSVSKDEIVDHLYKEHIPAVQAEMDSKADKVVDEKDVKAEIEKEILKLSQDQLAELKKLVKATTESKEDKLEEKIKSSTGELHKPDLPSAKGPADENKKQTLTEKLGAKAKDLIVDKGKKVMGKVPGILNKGKSLLSRAPGLVQGAGNLLSRAAPIASAAGGAISSAAGSVLSTVASGALRAGAVAAAPWLLGAAAVGAVGYGAYKLAKHVKGEDDLADGTEVKVMPDGSKILTHPDGTKTLQKIDGTTAKMDKDGKILPPAEQKLDKDGKPIPPEAQKLDKDGKPIPESPVASPAATPVPTASPPSKVDLTPRAEQSNRVISASASDSDKKRTESKAMPSINAPTTNINNSSGSEPAKDIVRPQVRTPEASFNRVLNNIYIF